jgi:hypothetical protein
MASWALACKNCRKVFTYSQIPDTVADYYLPTRPKFPPSGVERECPIARSNPPTRQPNSRFSPTASARIVVPNDRCGHLGVLASVSALHRGMWLQTDWAAWIGPHRATYDVLYANCERVVCRRSSVKTTCQHHKHSI